MTIAEFINSLHEDHPVRKSEDIMSFLTLWKESATEGPLKSELRGCTGADICDFVQQTANSDARHMRSCARDSGTGTDGRGAAAADTH